MLAYSESMSEDYIFELWNKSLKEQIFPYLAVLDLTLICLTRLTMESDSFLFQPLSSLRN